MRLATPAAAAILVGRHLLEEGCAIMADEMTEEAPAPTSTATTQQTEPAVIAGISSGEGEMVWSFEIVPVGGHQRLAAGNFNAPDIEAAQRHAQTVNEPHVSASADLDVRLSLARRVSGIARLTLRRSERIGIFISLPNSSPPGFARGSTGRRPWVPGQARPRTKFTY
jgi:hypothetical protein